MEKPQLSIQLGTAVVPYCGSIDFIRITWRNGLTVTHDIDRQALAPERQELASLNRTLKSTP